MTINGTNFGSSPTVKFNGTAATSPTVNGAGTQITATVPAGAASGKITVEVAGQTTATSSTDFTVTSASAPAISSISPAMIYAGLGQTVVITGSNFTGATGVTFGALNAASFTVNSPTQITATPPTAAVSGAVTVTGPAGSGGGATLTVTALDSSEVVSGDYANTTNSPTSLNLGTTSKLLAGTVGSGDADYVTFTVPSGYRLNGLNLKYFSFTTDQVAFMAIDSGATWTAGQTTADMLGFSHFGTADLNGDLLTKMSVAESFLPAGTYTIWIQQLSAANTYVLEFELAAAPALTLSLNPTAVNENAGATASTGTVGIPAALSGNLTVSLVSSNTAAATVPASVVITNGQTNATFAIAALANTNSFAAQTAAITASASGYASATQTLTVNNTDVPAATFISLTNTNANSYTQSFDGLGTNNILSAISATANLQTSLAALTSVASLNGWYATKIGGVGNNATAITADAGGGNSGSVYSYGATNAPDRALGVLASGSNIMAIGALIKNETGGTINSILVSFTAEFWRSSTSTQNTLTCAVGKIDGTTITTGNFLSAAGATPLVGLNIVGPALVTTNGPLDGNVAPNRTTFSNVMIPVQLAPGETAFVRWQDANENGNDAGLAIDDLSMTVGDFIAPPNLASISPTSVFGATTNDLILTLTGSGFVTNSVAKAGTYSLATTFVSESSLTALVPAALLVAGQTLAITVENTGAASAPQSLAVTYPAPTLTALSPASVGEGSTNVTVFLSGSGFTTNTAVSWAGNPIPATWHSAALFSIQPSAAQLAAAGTNVVTVSNPGTSTASLDFTVTPAGLPSLTTDVAVLSNQFVGAPGSTTIPDFYQSFLLSGANLTGDVTLTAPAAFEISADFQTTWGPTATLTAADLNGFPVQVFVRYTPTVAGTDTGLILVQQAEASTAVLVSGTSEKSLQLSASSFSWSRTSLGQYSTYSPALLVTGLNLTADVTVTTDGSFELSNDNGATKTNQLTFSPAGDGSVNASLKVYFRPETTNSVIDTTNGLTLVGAVVASSSSGGDTLNRTVALTGNGNLPYAPNLSLLGGDQSASVNLSVPTTTNDWTITADTFLVLAQAGNVNSNAPVAGSVTGYSASSVFGAGTPVGSSFVVYKGSGLSATNFTLTGLANRSQYTLNAFAVSAGKYVSRTNTRSVMVAAPLTNVIAQWNFNALTSTTQGDHNIVPADQGLTNAQAFAANGVTGARINGSDWDTNSPNYGWTTANYGNTNGTSGSLSAVVFAVSTAGKKDIEIEYDTSASSTGAKFTVVEISTNGSTWIPVFTNELGSSSGSWQEKRWIDLRSNTNVNNQASFQFRIRPTTNTNGIIVNLSGTNAFSTGGTTRFDRVTVAGVDGQFPPVISGPTTLTGTVGVPITPVTVAASGSPTSFSAVGLPAGLTINATTGQITGTPEAAATGAIVQLSASNVNGAGTANLSVTIAKGTPAMTAAPTVTAITAGQALSNSIISGGTVTPSGGTWVWSNPANTNTVVGTNNYAAVYTPASGDQVNWNSLTHNLTVVVNAAAPSGSSFSGWLGTNSPSAALLAQYAYGAVSASNTVDRANLPAATLSNNSLVLTYFVRKEATNPNLVVPQVHTNLADVAGWGSVANSNISEVGTSTVNGVEVIQKQATVPVDGTRKFLRLKIAE